MANPSVNYQSVYSGVFSQALRTGQILDLPIYYTANDALLSGLTLNIFFDSSLLELLGYSSSISASISGSSVLQDSTNLDLDPLTDKIVQFAWGTFNDTFPGVALPAVIANIKFRIADLGVFASPPTSTVIYFTAPETAIGYGFVHSDPIIPLNASPTPVDGGSGTIGSITSLSAGVFQEGATLTAPAVTGDPDGDAVNPNPAYQWFRNGTAIVNATSATYQVPGTGAGTYKVAVTYSDAQDYRSTVESTERVVNKTNNGNGAIGSITSLSAGIFREGATLTAPSVTGDPDGDAINPNPTYQWLLNGNAISGAIKATLITNGVVGAGFYSVQQTYADAQGFIATITSDSQAISAIDNGQASAAAITAQNNAAFNEGVTLIAGAITGDPDGNGSISSYQWFLNNTAIPNATSSAYSTSATGAGSYSVKTNYIDGQGFASSITSATKTVAKVDNGKGSQAAITAQNNAAFNEGVTLIAGAITGDPDGNGSITGYQWFFNNTPIPNATKSSYSTSATGAGSYSVKTTYIDAQGFTSSFTSTTQAVAKIDNGQAAAAAITAQNNAAFNEGVTLVAGAITGDPDGNGAITGYQWFLNNTPITNATKSSYSTSATGAGSYTVQTTYTDGQGFSSSLTSTIRTVAKIDNGKGTAAAITAQNNAAFNEGVTLIAGAITGDPDGNGSISSYQWFLNNTAIPNATSSAYSTSATGAGSYSVKTNYIDGQGFASSITSATKTVAKVDNGKGSQAAITAQNNAAFNEGVTLIAGAITGDPDGNGSITGYQWFFNNTPIPNATKSSYSTSATGAGSYSVKTTYIDAQGFLSVIDSASQVVESWNFLDIGILETYIGSIGNDVITGIPGAIAYGGAGNDTLVGKSIVQNGIVIPSFLCGGSGNDTYQLTAGSFSVIEDAGGGGNRILAPTVDLSAVDLFWIDDRDVLASDGTTTALLIDPLGLGSAKNYIESVTFKGNVTKTNAQLASLAQSVAIPTTYWDLYIQGILSANLGIGPSNIDASVNAVLANSSLLG